MLLTKLRDELAALPDTEKKKKTVVLAINRKYAFFIAESITVVLLEPSTFEKFRSRLLTVVDKYPALRGRGVTKDFVSKVVKWIVVHQLQWDGGQFQNSKQTSGIKRGNCER